MEFFHEQVRILRDFGLDCDVLYYPPGSRNAETLHDGILGKIYGHNPAYYAIRGSLFYPLILKTSIIRDYDIVHVNSGVVAPLGLLQPNRPIVLTLWGDDLLGDRLGGYQSKIVKFCAGRCDRVIVRNEKMQSVLDCEAEIIPSGVDLSKFRPISRTNARTSIGWSEKDRHVLFPYARYQEKKQYPVARQIVDEVNRNRDETVHLKEVSNIPHEEMYRYYNAADVLLLPSLREGSPNTVKEAMACNVPVVSTDVGDVNQRLGPVANSFVVEDEKSLTAAIHSVLDTDARSNGREYLEPLSLERMGNQIVEIYETVRMEQTSGKKSA